MPVTVITGSTSGIGKSIANLLAERGHTVVVTARRSEDADRLSNRLSVKFGRAAGMCLDVTNRSNADEVVSSVVGAYGGVDCWVNNAGISAMAPFLDKGRYELERTMNVNLIGLFECSQAVGKVMKRQGYGRIVNIASMAGKDGNVKYLADYVASKFAVIGLTQAMAAELADFGISVNSVCPGFVDTPMQSREIAWQAELDQVEPAEVRAGYTTSTPLKRLSVPEDTARAVAFLLSDDADFITGEALSVNGGAYMD